MNLQRMRIFVSSPGDVLAAREMAAQTIDKLRQEYASRLAVEHYLWEYEPMLASGHFQDSIEPPRNFDAVVIILESRLGTPMPERFHGIDGRTPVTGTEWEFEDALDGSRNSAGGLPHLLVYRSRRKIQLDPWDIRTRQETLQQIDALDKFWSRHFSDGVKFIGAYSEFESLESFAARLEADLRTFIERRIAQLQVTSGATEAPRWSREPFRGLEAYEIEHAPIFFGRDGATGLALRRLIDNAQSGRPFLLVSGPSGCGKSSLVKAGILPRLLVPRRVSGTAFPGRALFRVSEMRPDEDIYDALARRLTLDEPGFRDATSGALAEHLRQATAHPDMPFVMVMERLARDARAAGHMLDYEQAKLILVIDQLEELFTTPGLSHLDRAGFVRLLAGLLRSGRVWIVCTLRADFWHRAAEFPQLLELADGHGRLDLPAPVPAEISQMIRGPAEAAGLRFETDAGSGIALNDLIAQEAAAGPGSLPLLSYVLTQLYHRDIQGAGRNLLTYASYAEVGGLRGAIATRAKTVLEAQPPEVRAALPQVLFALVQVSSTGAGIDRPVARTVPLSSFTPGTPKRLLVDALLDPSARLLVADDSSGVATVRLAHEALLTEWQAAREEIEKSANALRILQTIEERHARYQAVKERSRRRAGDGHVVTVPLLAAIRERLRRESGLLTDIDLNDGRYLLREHRQELPAPLIDYIQRSSDRERARRQRAVRVTSAVAIVMGLLAAAAWYEQRVAQSESATAGRTVKFLVSIFEQGDPERNKGQIVTAKELLDQAARSVDHGLDNELRTRSELRTAMAESYAGLGMFPEAEMLLSQAKADQDKITVPAEARVQTMSFYGSAMLNNDPEGEEERAQHERAAVQLLRDAVNLARARLPPSSPERSEALIVLADAVAGDDPKEAESLCQEAIKGDRQQGKDGAWALANALTSLGRAYYREGKIADTEGSWQEAALVMQQVFGPLDARTARALDNLGVIQYESGQYDKAARTYAEILPIYQEIYGDKAHPAQDPEHHEFATLLNNISRARLMAGQVTEAERLVNRALAIDNRLVGDNRLNQMDVDFVSTLNSLGMIDAYRGRWQKAGTELAQAEKIARLPGALFLDQVLLNEADVALHAGDLQRGEQLLTDSLASLKQAHENDATNAWRYAVWDSVNAELLAAQGKTDDALRTLAAAGKVLRARFGPRGLYPQLVERRIQLIRSSVTRDTA
jgi:tetratricopeptide (TPR) repeat protein